MLGRRLDRYVTSLYLWHLAVCFLAVLGLYVVVDTFAHLDDFSKQGALAEQVRAVVTYHAYQIPVLVGQFLPVVVLLAGIIAVGRLSTYNEINAMKAAGVSIHRILLPVFLASFGVGLLGMADQELLVPSLEGDILQIRGSVLKGRDVYRDLFAYDSKERTGVMVQTLLNSAYGFNLQTVEVRPRQPAAGSERPSLPSLRAARAVWVDRWAFLFDGATPASAAEARPFRARTVLVDVAAAEFSPPLEPQAQLADGTRAHVVGAQLDGKPVDLVFAAWEPISRQRMILRGQITGVYRDSPPGASTADSGHAPAPIDVVCALWLDGQWLGRAQTYRQISPEKRELIVYDGDPLPLSLPPQELIQSRTDPTLKSIPELYRLARRVPSISQRLLIDVYTRLAFPLANVALLLVAIPLLFQQEGGKSTLLGTGLASFVGMSYYVVSYAFLAIGRDPDGIFGGLPWLAAWLPILLFGIAGAILLWNMDT